MPDINDFIPITGASVVSELNILANRLQGKKIINVNSTAVGGGVAEILSRMLPLLQQLQVDAHWDVIKGNERFFVITKKMHNALHGGNDTISPDEFDFFLEVNRENGRNMDLDADVVFIHDPQPIALIEKKDKNRWIWRCHIDFTSPQEITWNFLKQFIDKYDCSVFSAPAFSRPLSIRQVLIQPSIDPLSDKNREVDEETIDRICAQFGLDRARPIITQISRFDYLKDPVGVIQAYLQVKKHLDCQLVLAGGGASDDPEGAKVLEEVKQAAGEDPDIFVLLLPPASDLKSMPCNVLLPSFCKNPCAKDSDSPYRKHCGKGNRSSLRPLVASPSRLLTSIRGFSPIASKVQPSG
jgi:trehalose synthase